MSERQEQSAQDNTTAPENNDTSSTEGTEEQGSTQETTQQQDTLLSGKTKKETQEEEAVEAPEYESFNFPEGMTLSEAVLKDFTALARKSKLTQEEAQKFVDLSTFMTTERLKKEASELEALGQRWREELRTDPDFGGDKEKETVERANRALRRYGSAALIKFLNQTGTGNNPELVKAFARIDKNTGEDSLINGEPPPPEKKAKSAAEVMFPNQGKE